MTSPLADHARGDAARAVAHGDKFAAFLARVRPQIDDYLASHAAAPMAHAEGASAPDGPGVSRDLGTYLYQPLAEFTSRGGKRTRPALAVLGAEAVGAAGEEALPAAAAVELFQSAALVHDDIADEGELRRGKPCLHRTEGVGIATNVGDLGIVQTFGLLLDGGDLVTAVRMRLLDELLRMERWTLEGQALDLGWARDGRWDVTVADYLAMATRKTAYYSAAVPLAMGAISGGGTDAQVEALRAFGMDAGLAFQLQDDLLNLVGDASRQGKDFRSDITEGKRTMAVCFALEHLGMSEREELVAVLSGHVADADTMGHAVDLMEGCGALAAVRAKARDLAASAKGRLAGVELAGNTRELLESMADFFVERAG